MRVLSLALILLASCLANQVANDAGADAESSACTAAGGSCVAPGPACVTVVSLNISCGGNGTICCTAEGTPGADAATAATVPTGSDATTTGASGCDITCEMTCEGDPNCIENCGC